MKKTKSSIKNANDNPNDYDMDDFQFEVKNNIISKFINNPSINKFNYNSFFIFDQNDNIKYYQSLSNKNLIKLNNEEISFLKEIVNNINFDKCLSEKNELIEIEYEMADKLTKFFDIKPKLSPISTFIKEKINNNPNRVNISCRKLANCYFNETGNKISKSTIHNVMKKELGYHYLKTTLKHNNLNKKEGILACLCFIKIMVRCLKLNFIPIFIDESKVEIRNNHYRTWRFPDEELFFGNLKKTKCNLLLAVGANKVFHFKINNENTTSTIFLLFLKELEEILSKDKKNKYILILDNFRCHKTEEVIEFLFKSKLNTLFNAPYCSSFNSVELAFRSIKKITYANIYDSIDNVVADIKNYLEKDEIRSTLSYNFKETIEKYIHYSEAKKSLNLNNFNN